MIKSGVDHIASLRDDRAVYLHGKRIDDVTSHPAYANSVKSIGRLFDFPLQHPELMTFVAGVVDRDASGVTVRGAKMLATGGIRPTRSSSPASSRFSQATRSTPCRSPYR